MEETNWADEMTWERKNSLGEKINAREFDHVFQITAGGVIDGPVGIYAPEGVEHDSEHDVLVGGVPYKEIEDWTALTGYTGQYSYHGVCMHPSEFVGGRLAHAMIEQSAQYEAEGTPLLWAMTSVEDPEDSDYPVGWAIFYRAIS